MLYSPQHNVVVYQSEVPERILNCVPAARRMNGQAVIIPCDIKNMQTMRQLGYPAFSPILANYDWPHDPNKFNAPFDHQRHMAAFLTLHPRSFNLSDMGTGKTLSALWAFDFLKRHGAANRMLVLAPLSTIYRVWEDECFTHFLTKLKVVVLYGDRAKRLELLKQPADIYIINHDGLGVGTAKTLRGLQVGELAQAIKDRPDIDCILVDEGSVYKDSSTLRYKVLRHVVAEKPYVWWMTGTPVPVEPTNAWSQARIVRRDYGESYKNFRERTMMKLTQFKWIPRHGSLQIAAQVLQPAIRFNRDECLDLPDCMVETRDVELSVGQRKAYDELKKQLKVQIGLGQITAINEASLRLKLIQIACGAVYGPDHEAHRVDASPRLQVLHEVIEESGGKLLIFAPLTSVINLLYAELRKGYSVERIIGDVSAKKRGDIFRDFQQKDSPRIIVADPGTMAHGLTLTAAATIVWYGPTDKPEIYQQANARINRPGQKNSMLIVRLTATPIEREIFRRLDNRDSMQGLILDLIKGD